MQRNVSMDRMGPGGRFGGMQMPPGGMGPGMGSPGMGGPGMGPYPGGHSPHGMYPGGMPMVSPRSGVDGDRWQRLPPGQQQMMMMGGGGRMPPGPPPPPIHKSENRYEVGKISSEEEKKQRQVKGILNKLTPQNFDRLFEQVKELNIDSVQSLTGVIGQIFDKALLEPTFCEMYAEFCGKLSEEMPEFEEEMEGREKAKVTFRRTLLNKCQVEFERGVREQLEAEREEEEVEVEEEGEKDGKEGKGGEEGKAGEEGEAAGEGEQGEQGEKKEKKMVRKVVKLSEEERQSRRQKAKRRTLGNIRFIGELFKKKMITERIMHECIKKLLTSTEVRHGDKAWRQYC